MNTKKETIRFLIAGTIAGATDFGVYYSLIHRASFSFAKGISFGSACIVAYLFNKHWVFQSTQSSSYSAVSRYLIVMFLALGINIVINQGILKVWPGAVLLALIIASMLTGLFTFVCFKWWVFKLQLTGDRHPRSILKMLGS